MGLKLMKGLKIQIGCIIPCFLAYKGRKSTNAFIIRFDQAEESKYEILIALE